MYLIAIAWIYVVLLVSLADTTVVGGVLTFLFAGAGPLALFLWLFGTPQRRRNAARRSPSGTTSTNDRTDSKMDQ
ncbi:MAG TPA: hypothetical protein PL143_03015 [Rhodocyclaceae bacterium]|nr:hypothetical protein [Rhodocyclaceae bacterium]